MISDHIKDLIIAAKALPNSLERNKSVSHLEDARVWMESLELKEGKRYGVPPESSHTCICPPGAVDPNCPVHGGKSV